MIRTPLPECSICAGAFISSSIAGSSPARRVHLPLLRRVPIGPGRDLSATWIPPTSRLFRGCLRLEFCHGTPAGVTAPPNRPKTPGSTDTGGTNGRCEHNGAEHCPCGRLHEVRTEPGERMVGPPAPPAGGAEMVPIFRPTRPSAKDAAGAMHPARCSACEGSGAARRACRLSLPPPAEGVRIGAKGVVTGAKSGLRASGGKDRANRKAREALVTGWYGAATTELPPAAWSAEADVGAERRNQVPLSRSIAMSRADAPPQARRATPDRRRARSTQTARRLPRGFLWPRGDRGTPRD